jgi:TM2 domain-containing membrane protein YozV
MEFVDGANLREIEQAGKLTPDQAVSIVPQICEALQFAHNEGIVHRDIKPENLLLDKKGRLKITDFGIAKIMGVSTGKSALTGAQDVMGTPHYMAPEQIENPQAVDHRADIYSLGVVFYEMLTGELPLGKFSPPSQKASMDVRLDEVVMHTLEKEPGQRYQQASQVKTDVETIAGTAASFASAAPSAAKAGTPPPGTTIPPLSGSPASTPLPIEAEVSDKLILPAFLLAFFFGIFGAHRIYVGKVRTAILQAGCVFGGIFMLVLVIPTHLIMIRLIPVFAVAMSMFILVGLVWAVIDCILLLCKAFTDRQGRRLTKWVHSDANPAARPTSGFSASAPVNPTATAGFAANPAAPKNPPGGAPPIPPVSGGGGAPGGGGPFGASGPFGENNPFGGKPSAGDSAHVCIKAPAIGLIVAGVFKLISALKALFFFSAGNQIIHSFFPQFNQLFPAPWSGMCGAGVMFFTAIPAALIIFGGVEMLRLRSYGWAVAAAIISIVACSILGLPVGIWALIILLRPGTREKFSNAPVAICATKWLGAAFILILLLCLSVVATGWLSDHHASASGGYPRIISGRSADYQPAAVPMVPPVPAVPSVPGVPNGSKVPATPATPAPPTAPGGDSDITRQTISVGDQTDFSKTFNIQPGGNLDINVDRGDITVTGSEQTNLTVKITREVSGADGAGASGILIGENLLLKQDDNSLSITAQEPLGLNSRSFLGWVNRPNLNARYEIALPRKFQVQLATAGGNVEISSVTGRVKLDTSGGGLVCRDINGEIKGETSGGDINADGCQGELRLDTSGGSVSIGNFTGPDVHATTSGGNISVDFAVAPKADCDLQTSGGNVSASLPANASINLDAHTDGGSVKTELPVEMAGQLDEGTLKGPINGGGPGLKLETSGGNIDIRKQH